MTPKPRRRRSHRARALIPIASVVALGAGILIVGTASPGVAVQTHGSLVVDEPITGTAPTTAVPTTAVPTTTGPAPTTTVRPTTTVQATTTSPPRTTLPATTTTGPPPPPPTTTPTPTSSTAPPPPRDGAVFVAEFATPQDFAARFEWHWGMLPDPRTFDIPAEGLTAQADHSEHADGSCGPPTQTRTVRLRVPEEQVFWCGPNGPESGHVMTATPFTGYGILTFAPRQRFTNVHRICWDQNLTFLGGRRWTNMLVVPEQVYQSNAPRLDYASPGFGPGFDVGALNLDTPDSVRTVKVFMGAVFWHPTHSGAEAGNNGGVIFSNEDRATRYTHCIEDLDNGTVRVTQERPGGGQRVDVWPGDLPDGPVRVLFQDDRYDTSFADHPITWHWDNIVIE